MKEGWEYKKLGELGTFQRGKGIRKTDFVEKGKPCIHYGQLHTEFGVATKKHIREVSDSVFNESPKAHKGDLLFALTSEDVEGSCKATAWLADYDVAVSSDAAIYSHQMNSVFVSYFFQSKMCYRQKARYAQGFKVTHIKPSEVASFTIPLPPLSVQQSIVAELDKINEIIDLKKAQLKDLDLLAQSIFYDMFGDPIENPKGWEVKKLGEVCKLSQGLAINKQTKHYLSDIPTSIPLLRIKDMKDGTREIFVKEDDCPTSCMAYPDDIIYTRTGTLGLAFTNMYGIMHNNCFKIVTNEELVKVFFMNYIQGEWFKSNITRLASRSSQPDITHKLFLSQSIIVPPLSLQQSFAEKIQAIESQKSAIKQSLADVETLLASRMDYWFN